MSAYLFLASQEHIQITVDSWHLPLNKFNRTTINRINKSFSLSYCIPECHQQHRLSLDIPNRSQHRLADIDR